MINEKCTMMITQFLLSVEIFWYRHYSQLSPSKRHLSGVPLYAGNRWTLVRDFTVFGCLRLRMHKVDWNRVGEWEQVFKLKSQRHNMNKRDFLYKKHYLGSCFSNYKNSSVKTNPSDSNEASSDFFPRCIRNKNVNSDASNKELSDPLHFIPMLVTHRSIFSRGSMAVCRMTKVL